VENPQPPNQNFGIPSVFFFLIKMFSLAHIFYLHPVKGEWQFAYAGNPSTAMVKLYKQSLPM